MRRPIGFCLLLGALLLGQEGLSQPAREPSLAPLTTVEALQKVPREQARRGLPVVLRGVVTFVNENRLLFVQDRTGGTYCEPIGLRTMPPLGHEVEISGFSAAGSRRAYLRAQQFHDLGPATLPPARPTLSPELWEGKLDAAWVRVVGYVAKAELVTNPLPVLQLRLASAGPDVSVMISLEAPIPLVAELPGACISVQGVCAQQFARGRIEDVILLSAQADMFQILTNANEVLANLAPTPIKDLLKHTNTGGLVRARGTVVLAGADDFWLGEPGSGIDVWAASTVPVKQGEQVDLVGFLRVNQSERTLGLTRLVTRTEGQLPAPVRLPVPQLFDPARYGQVVEVEGEFLHRLPDRRGDVLVMREGEKNFEARILFKDGGEVQTLAGGSRLRLTGVLRWLPSDRGGMSAPRLLVADAAGLEKLTPPPWPMRRTLAVVVGLAVGLAGGLLALGYAHMRLRESNRRAAAAEREVRELNADLEQRIQRRTAELRATNDSLSAEVQERRKALEALEAETRERQTLLQRTRDGVVVLAMDGTVFEANRKFAEMLGYTPEQLLGLHVWDWSDEFNREQLLQRLQEVDADGRHFITRHRSKDASVRSVEVSSSATLWRGQKYVLCVCRDITERLARERALRESEERYRTFLRLSTEGFSRWEEEEPISTELPVEEQVQLIFEHSKLVECNDAFAQMYGYACAQDVVGTRLPELFPPSDPRNVELLRDYVRNGYRLKDAESVEHDRAGNTQLFLNNLVGIVERGQLISGWNTQRDITARKQAEDSLRASEERLRAVVEAIAEMVWVGEPGKIQPSYVSPAFVKIWSRPIQFLYESPTAALDTIHRDDRARFLDTIQRQAGGERTAIEYRILRPDGSVRWIWDQGFPVKDASGRVAMVNGIASDITERRRTEETLKLFRTLVDQSNDALEVIDPMTGRILDVSLRGCLELGYTREEMLELRILDIDPQLDESTWAMRMDGLRRTKALTVSARHRRKDGTTFPVEVNIAWVELDREYLVAVVRDTTERLQAEEARQSLETQLRHAQKMEAIGTLAGGIAHDFNNILGSIVGYTELARLDCADRPLVLENLECVLQASARAKGLIRQILAFSRPHRGELKPVPIAAAMTEATRLVRATIPATIEIVSEIGAADVNVLAESTQLHQILINLATNAAHAMKDGGVLRICLEQIYVDAEKLWTLPDLKIGPYIQLTVSDTGHGMNSSTLERIFEPFFTTKPPGEGTGLGLSVVHGIVQSCCGAITVESRAGEGSRFEVYLPALSPCHVESTPSDVPIPRGRNERVLLVEDEAPLARVGRRMMESLGYSVMAFTDPMEALSTFLQRPGEFDLVVTDLTMPGLDGLKLTEEILRSRPGTPVVLTTGFEGSLTASRAQALGVRELLQKPNSIESLGLALRRALEPSTQRT